MGLNVDKILLLNLTAATTSGTGNWIDLSSYKNGVLWVVTTAFSGTSWSPNTAVLVSPDNGVHSLALPGAEWAAAWTSITAVNVQRAAVPVVAANGASLNLGYIQVAYTITAATVTAQMFFVGHI